MGDLRWTPGHDSLKPRAWGDLGQKAPGEQPQQEWPEKRELHQVRRRNWNRNVTDTNGKREKCDHREASSGKCNKGLRVGAISGMLTVAPLTLERVFLHGMKRGVQLGESSVTEGGLKKQQAFYGVEKNYTYLYALAHSLVYPLLKVLYVKSRSSGCEVTTHILSLSLSYTHPELQLLQQGQERPGGPGAGRLTATLRMRDPSGRNHGQS